MRRQLKLMGGGDNNCHPKVCPTIYEDVDGGVLIQGKRRNAADYDINVPDDEDIVWIPMDVFDQALASRREALSSTT